MKDRELNVNEQLELVAVSQPVTYRFRAKGHFGWACATVNEETGELLVTSDWGEWGHRWNPAHLGEPSLHRFLGRAPYDYIANKLLPYERDRVFSSHQTRRCIQRYIIESHDRGDISRTKALNWLFLMADIDFDTQELYLSTSEDIGTKGFLPETYAGDFIQTEESMEYWCLTRIVLPPICAVCREKAPEIETQLKNQEATANA